MRQYLVTWSIKKNGSVVPMQMTISALTAKEARRSFEESWGYARKNLTPYPFHLKVQLLRR